jgi:hypothetical protein
MVKTDGIYSGPTDPNFPLEEIKIAVGQWIKIRKPRAMKANSTELLTIKRLEGWLKRNQ